MSAAVLLDLREVSKGAAVGAASSSVFTPSNAAFYPYTHEETDVEHEDAIAKRACC